MQYNIISSCVGAQGFAPLRVCWTEPITALQHVPAGISVATLDGTQYFSSQTILRSQMNIYKSATKLLN